MSEYVKMDIPSLAAQNKIEWFDFREGDKVLNIGCGPDYVEGWTNLDGDQSVKADVHYDINKGLPFKDNSFDVILASHILEHIPNLVELQKEFNRVLRRPHGRAFIIVPHYSSPDAWGDPTHCRAFSNQSFWPCYWPGITKLTYNVVPVQPSEGPQGAWITVTLFYGEELKDGE